VTDVRMRCGEWEADEETQDSPRAISSIGVLVDPCKLRTTVDGEEEDRRWFVFEALLDWLTGGAGICRAKASKEEWSGVGMKHSWSEQGTWDARGCYAI